VTTDSSRRQKPGPGKPLIAQRELYLRLMKQGLNNSEACRLLGIHRKTGQRWRHGRRHRARAASTTTGRSPRRRPQCQRGSCPKTNASASPTCIAGAGQHGRSPASWAAIRPRSAGNCAATPIPPPAPIGPSARTGAPWAADRDHDRPSWPSMSNCAQWSNSCSTGGGVPSRSATSCATASQTSRRGIWCPKPSIRRSTCKDLVPRHCQLEQSEGDFRRFASAIHQVACDV
jgi:hypothetical protein